MNRRVFHVILSLLLVACLICPFVEFAIGWNDTLFSTGHDTESSLALVTLLLELVFMLAGLVALLVPDVHVAQLLVTKNRALKFELDCGGLLTDSSPPLPLRI
jgi:hypothetical protein